MTPFPWLFALLPASSVQINDIKLADCVPSQDVLKQAEKIRALPPHPTPLPLPASSVCHEPGLGGRKQLPLPPELISGQPVECKLPISTAMTQSVLPLTGLFFVCLGLPALITVVELDVTQI